MAMRPSARGTARLALLAALAGAASCRGSDGSASPAVGRELETFSFPDLDGRTVAWSPGAGLGIDGGEARRPDALLVHVFQPDCAACRQQARELERLAARDPRRSATLGVAHRRGPGDLRAFAENTGASYPLLLGTGSDWASRWGRGDSLYIVDRQGRIAYAQVGFHPSDVERWQAVLEDLAAGRAARHRGPQRDALVVGEALPEIALPLVDGRGSARLGLDEQGALVAELPGERRRLRAAIGFFSRY
jgi:peroxiredoxin